MSQRVRRLLPALLFMAVITLLGSGQRVDAALITEIKGQFGLQPGSFTISTRPDVFEDNPVAGGLIVKTFYLAGGRVTDTTGPSPDLAAQNITNLTIDLTNFIDATNASVDISATGVEFDFKKLFIGQDDGEGGTVFVEFDIGNSSVISFDKTFATATIHANVTLADFNVFDGSDFSAFNTAGGGDFLLQFDNVLILPEDDGHIFFPIDPNLPVTVSWSITPVPEPPSILGLLTGAGLALGWLARRVRVQKKK